jgi:hypothetical protein
MLLFVEERMARPQSHGWRVRAGLSGFGLAVVLWLVPAKAAAQGGPPMVVDDPDTPGPGHWEINLAGVLEKSHTEQRLEAPLADINYGVGDRIQLKFEIPWLSVRPVSVPVATGLGQALVGVKWRFLGQEGRRIAWSIYPQMTLGTGKSLARQGLLDDGVALLLPTELTLQLGAVEINSEVGRNFVQSGASGWIDGASTEIELRAGLELLGVISNDVVHSGLLQKNGGYHTNPASGEGAPSEDSS